MDSAQIQKISKALADQDLRLRIFEAIAAREEKNCGGVVAFHGVTPGIVSHPLRIFAEAGLIECRRNDRFIYNKAIRRTLASNTTEATLIGS